MQLEAVVGQRRLQQRREVAEDERVQRRGLVPAEVLVVAELRGEPVEGLKRQLIFRRKDTHDPRVYSSKRELFCPDSKGFHN